MTRTETPVLLYSKNACEFHGDHSKITTRRCHAASLFAWKFRTTEYIKESFADGIQQICTFAWLFFFARVEQNRPSVTRNPIVAQHAARVRRSTVSAVRGSVFDVRRLLFSNRLLRREPRRS